MSEVAATGNEPTFATAPVNVDSLKEILSRFADAFPFVDETSANAFREQINNLHQSGDPHAVPTLESKDDEIARLRAELEAAQANKA